MTGGKWLVIGIAAALLMTGAATGVSLASGADTSSPSISSNAPQTVAPEGGRKQPSPGSFKRAEGFAIVKAIQQLSGKTPEELRALKEGKTWQQVAASLGLNWEQVQAEAKKLAAARFQDRGMARAILKLSGKTPEELRALKEGKTWQQVAESLGLNWQQVQAEARKLAAEQPKDRGFKHDGAQMRDRAIVSFLAELTGKAPKDILALKTKDNTWVDVARQLGVTIAR